MATEHHIREADRNLDFWKLLLAVAHGRAPKEVLADWLEDRSDPRAVIARNARPTAEQTDEHPRYAWQREPYTAVDGHEVTPVSGITPMHYHRGLVTLASANHPNARRIRAGEEGLDFEFAKPVLVWRQGPLALHAPVSIDELHDFIDKLPEGRVRDEWRREANFHGWPEPLPHKLARTKAPAGGMIVNNVYQQGGQFLAAPLEKIRDAVAKWRARQRVKLARARTPEDPLPGHLEPAMYAAGFSPDQEVLTPQQIEHIASAHGLPTPDLRTREQREKFFDKLVTVRQPVANIKKRLLDKRTDPRDVLTYIVPHLVADAHAYKGNASQWYGTDVDKMERGVHRIFGKGWEPGSANQTLLKVLIAATSAGQKPSINVPNAIRIVEAGQHIDPRDVWRNLPHAQTPRLEAWLATQEPGAQHVGHTLKDNVEWWLAHDKPDSRKAEFRSYPAKVTNLPDTHPDHDKVIAYEAPTSQELEEGEKRSKKLIVLPGMGKYLGDHNKKFRKNAALPVPDENGNIQAKAWTARDSSILADKLDTLKHIVDHFGGNLPAVQSWLISDHPREEFAAVTGKPFEDTDEVLDPHEKVPGTFFLGPKFGAFALNLHQNTHPTLGRYITADVWWTRTWNRFMGTLRGIATGKPQETPRSPHERRLMWSAAKLAARMAGLRSVADLQACLWYHEQHLDRWFGGDAASTSVVDGINNALKQRGIKLKLQRTRSYWLSPHGDFHEVGDFGHEQFAKQQGVEGVPELQAQGWGRVVGAGGMLTFDRGMDRSAPNSRQMRALTNHAIEQGYGHVWHGGTDRPLWSRPSDEGPERLSRNQSQLPLTQRLTNRAERLKSQGKLVPFGRLLHIMLRASDRVWNPQGIGKVKLARIDPEVVKQFSDSHVKDIENHIKGGGTLTEAMTSPTVHQIFADRLEDADDPRHEIVRRSISDNPYYGLKPWSEGRARAIDIADGVPKGTTPDYVVRNPSRYAQLKRPNGEEMIVAGIPGKAGLGWHVHWGPPNAGLMGRYNAAFTGPELAALLRRMEPEDRAAIVRDLKRKQGPLRLSRVRELIDRHRQNPQALRDLAAKHTDGPVASLLHHIANHLTLGTPSDEIERGIDQWRKRRGWAVKLARNVTGESEKNGPIPEQSFHPFWINPTTGTPDYVAHNLHRGWQRFPRGSTEAENVHAALTEGDATAYRALIDKLHEEGHIDDETALTHRVFAAMMQGGRNARDAYRILDRAGETGSEGRNDRLTQALLKLEKVTLPRKPRGPRKKLARAKRFAHWMAPDGTLHQLGPTETHQEWADRRNESEESLKAKGWSRVVPEGDTLYVDRDLQRAGGLGYKESRAITDHAIQHNYRSVVLDGVRPRTIWEADVLY